ncbi:hypothetical protein [Streptomyces chryseus]|uniref:Uncharacterized protein n=1 Tax=Streptomyces chryseus TaxID=68186 RepID=A0ABQ3DKT0_9ACTN|nr:hypothetical protein [Streptomyces chryseus]GHB01846.1 hypothetical protein GCM10010346_25970 [Streptomyces chryseus]
MSDSYTQDPEDNGKPVPRDLPDQQAPDGEDSPNEAGRPAARDDHDDGDQASAAGQEPAPEEPTG